MLALKCVAELVLVTPYREYKICTNKSDTSRLDVRVKLVVRFL
jgi:hypothetical protein